MSATTSIVPKPLPAAKLSVDVSTRVTPAGKAILKALAEHEGLTLQQLGLYAWNLALHAYGRPPLPEADA
ncbi:MAG TPA: hypothetical protein VGG68_00765 [Caulobacteraceae bacterium]|jgi:hypothetical protein